MGTLFISDRWATAPELADYLNIDLELLYRRWRSWGLPGAMVGGQVRFDPDGVADWLEARKQAERAVAK